MIAARTLHSAHGDVRVELDAPVPDGADWRCAFRIQGPLGTSSARAMGVDAFQALQLALVRLAMDLRMGPEFAAGPLRWLDLDEPGFALPPGYPELSWTHPGDGGSGVP